MSMKIDTARVLAEMLRTLASTLHGIARVAEFGGARLSTVAEINRCILIVTEAATIVERDHG